MTKFIIQHDSPESHRDDIVRFWREYLPGASASRFEWLNKGNPAGRTDWFFAFRESSRDLSGMISIMPKEVYINGEKVRLGIVGDFMVSSKYRVFGPTFNLVSEVVSGYGRLGYAGLYTIPNSASKNIMLRAGFQVVGNLCSYVRPIDYGHYLEARLSPFWGKLCAGPLALLWNAATLESYRPASGRCEETSEITDSFDIVFQKSLSSSDTAILSNRCANYLQWRYSCDLEAPFRYILYYHDSENCPSGFAIFQQTPNKKTIIYDLLATDCEGTRQLLKNILMLSRRAACTSIEICTPRNDKELGRILNRFGFINAGDSMDVLYVGKQFEFCKWPMMRGDRNI